MLTNLWNSYSAWTANTLGISGTANLILAVLIVAAIVSMFKKMFHVAVSIIVFAIIFAILLRFM